MPSDDAVRGLLSGIRTIAVVGLSDNPARPSYDVASYLRRVGYTIVPINPMLKQWNGLPSFPDLGAAAASGVRIDLVDVFRRPEEVGPVVEDAIRAKARAIWFQLGVINEDAAKRAQEAGLLVVMDRCSKVEHRRLVR